MHFDNYSATTRNRIWCNAICWNTDSAASYPWSSWSQAQITMDAPLRDGASVEQGVLLRFIWGEVLKSAEIYLRMLAHYESENSMTQWKVYDWVERFQAGRTSVKGETPSAVPGQCTLPQQWSQCKSCGLNVFLISLAALICSHAIIMFSIHLKRLFAVAGSLLITTIKKRCKNWIREQPETYKTVLEWWHICKPGNQSSLCPTSSWCAWQQNEAGRVRWWWRVSQAGLFGPLRVFLKATVKTLPTQYDYLRQRGCASSTKNKRSNSRKTRTMTVK